MWIARATSSLPVPVSPRMRTVDVDGATCSTRASTSRNAGDSPTMAPKLNFPCASFDSMPTYDESCSARRRFSRTSAKRSTAWVRTPRSSFESHGLVT